MAETVEQYIKRIQGHVEGKDPLKVQKNTAKRIEKVIARLNKKQLRRRPGRGKWSIAEILAHLAFACN
ncbi:MAG TPA: DinB family protein [Terriglobales bacterium]|nr:DinB family protein [Terriglobales bacterium]